MYRVPKNSGKKRYEPPSPSYCSEDELEREEYFVANPDYEFDELPQPFKLIDKILQGLFDRLSDEINKVEKLKELKNNAKPIPIFDHPSIVDLSSLEDKILPSVNVNGDVINQNGCIYNTFKASASSSTIYIASGKKLKAINCFTKMNLAQIEVDTMNNICMLEAIPLGTAESGSAIDMIVSFDDSENGFSHLFDGKDFFPVKIFDSQSKVLQWRSCDDFSFVAIAKHQPRVGSFLELYRLPRNEWMSEYESAIKAFSSESKYGDRENMFTNNSLDIKSKPGNDVDGKEDFEEEGENQAKQKPPYLASYLKLRSIVAVATLKLPSEISGVTYSSTTKVNEGGRIGSGYKNFLGASFYKTLRSQLENDLSISISAVDENADLSTNGPTPTIHFLKGFGNKISMESKTDQKHCLYDFIGVWWSSTNQFLVYKLPKSSKDLDLQLEYSYTNADMIIRSCVNVDTSLIALALRNMNVIIWNRVTDEPSRVILLEQPDLQSMVFAKLHKSSERLIFGMKSGDILQLNCCTKDLSLLPLKDQSSIMQSDLLYFDIAPEHPSLLFVAKKPDFITVFDLNQQSSVLQFQLPSGYCLDHSISQCFVLNTGVPMLIVFAIMPWQYGEVLHGLFAYNMYIGDQSYQVPLPLMDSTSPCKIEGRGVNNLESIALELMASAHSKKQARQERQHKRWREFGKELKKRSVSFSDAHDSKNS